MKKTIIFSAIALAALSWTAAVHAMGISNLKHYTYYNRMRVHKLTVNHDVIYKLNTHYGYESIITLPGIPKDVTVGDKADFNCQTLGNQILVLPQSYSKKVSTNMEILMKQGLINVELVTSSKKDVTYDLDLTTSEIGGAENDYIKAKLAKSKAELSRQYGAKYARLAAEKKKVAKDKTYVEKLILSINKEPLNISASKGDLSFTILYKSRIGNKLYIAYEISNATNDYVVLHSVYLYGVKSSWIGQSSKSEADVLNPLANLKIMPREVYKGYIVYQDKNANDVSAHFFRNGKLIIIRVHL